jgi:subtilisin family serine protease
MTRHCIHPTWRLITAAVALLTMVAVLNWPEATAAQRGQADPPPGHPLDGLRTEPAPDWSAPHVPNQLLIKLPGDQKILDQVTLARAGVRLLRVIPQLGLALVETRPGAEPRAVAVDLIDRAGVEWAEPNYIFGLDFEPDDPDYRPRQSLYLNRLDMPAAWGYTTGLPQIVIAIVDTGVEMTHEDLYKAIWINIGEIPDNGIDDDGNGFVDDVNGWNFAENNNRIYDDYGHGTHVAGIAAARINNGVGIAGIAGTATIMPLDVFPASGYGTYEDLIRAMVYATDNGAHVINMSLGAISYSRGEEAAVNYAWSRGVVLVAAAGNTGRNSYHYPAAHPNVIAVAATDAYDNLAGFSTRGDFVDVAAPGVSIWSTYRGNRYGLMTGTSMAAPHVAGLAALILSLNPNLQPDDVRALIQDNADDLGTPGWDIYFGHGRINAGRALAAVPGGTTPLPTPTPGPRLEIWPAGCQELINDGDFEAGLGAWQGAGDVVVDTTRAYAGTRAAHFPGGPNSGGTLTRTVSLPPFPQEAVLWFAYRIENQDQGWGSSPEAPYDDWLTAEFRADDGTVISSLLRTGNSADTAAAGLPWDRYLYRMQFADLAPLRTAGSVALVFTAGNDEDNLPTDFWIDEVRLCVKGGYGRIFPLVFK